MFQVACPWCDEVVEASPDDGREEGTCPECRTTWAYEVADPAEMLLAA